MAQKRPPSRLAPADPAHAPDRVAPAFEPPPPSGMLAHAWWRIREFAGAAGNATYLWPRWIVLRAVGLVYIFVFAGIIREGQALVGPRGIAPLTEFFNQLHEKFPNFLEAFIRAPSLFWLSSSGGMVTLLAWAGLIAAVALVLNLWPRLALFGCWVIFVSFVTTWRVFSAAQLDRLMLETALLLIPFAPAGFRPGLGASSPPRPIAVLMVRWLLFRVMFESGLVKLTAGDPHWRNFTAMEVMYETSPFPTIFGYIDHSLPHAYHVFEIFLTFLAELVAPVVAVFGGRRGRWFAFWTWLAFQFGIQLTSNFGWLNTASIGLGFLLFDDQMLITAADRLGLRKLGAFLSARAVASTRAISAFKLYTLRSVLWLHFYLTLFFFAKACGVMVDNLPYAITWPVHLLWEFRSANGYYLYATFDPVRYQVEFEGSNDGGQTWRPYEFRYIPQQVDRISPFIAPWYARFEATVQIAGWNGKKSPLMPAVAAHLLARDPDVMRLFANDPFPNRPPTLIRMRGYRLTFTDSATQKRTARYWNREPAGTYLPMLYLDENGQVTEASLASADEAVRNHDYANALAAYEQQYHMGNLEAGFRLADMALKGLGVPKDPARAFALYTDLARQGEVVAEYQLGLCHEFGIGAPVNYPEAAAWYRLAAHHGSLVSVFNLGSLHARGLVRPRDDVEGLALLLEAGTRAEVGDDPASAFILQRQPAVAKELMQRMSVGDIAKAKIRAAARAMTPFTTIEPE
ncbi:MAG: lipase maturation factor family protein [Opitutaceae bacterium]